MTNNKGRALVTGGAGLVGSHLVDLLIQQGYEVTVLDNLEPQTHPHGKPTWVHPGAQFIQGDIRNDSDIEKALKGVRFVFHQAAFGGFTEAISKYIDVNVNGTAKIFEKIATGNFSVEKVVVASSQAVYAEGTYECPKDGQLSPPTRSLGQLQEKKWEPLCPKCGAQLRPSLTSEGALKKGETAYALSKEFEERLALSYGRQLKIPVVALRYAVTYGPRQSVFNPYTGVVSIFSTRILNNMSPIVYEDGAQMRDFIYVGDVARANLFVLENEKANHQVFNVSTGKGTSVAELSRILAALYEKFTEPEMQGQFRWGDVRHILLNPAKSNQLGFEAKTPLKEGLRLFAEWMKSQGPIKEYFTEAYNVLKQNRVIYD